MNIGDTQIKKLLTLTDQQIIFSATKLTLKNEKALIGSPQKAQSKP